MKTSAFIVYRIDEAGRWHRIASRNSLVRAWALCRKLAAQNPGTEYRLN